MMAKQPSPKLCGNCKLYITKPVVDNLIKNTQYQNINYDEQQINCPRCYKNNNKVTMDSVTKIPRVADEYGESRVVNPEQILRIMFENKKQTM